MEELKRLLFIYNPKSGHGAVNAHMGEILKAFEEAGFIPTIYRMRFPGDASDMTEKEGPEYDLVVCAGGDGTLSSVITGAMRLPSERRPVIGFIPTGSTNDTRASYDLPLNIQRAAKLSVTGTPFATDIGEMREKYFTYVASFGDLSAVSCFTSQVAKNLLGRGAYLAEGIKQLIRMNSHVVTVRYDDKEITGDFFLGMVTNATSVGGFAGIAGRNVDLQDGLFEVLLVKKPADLIEFNKEVQTILLDPNNQTAVEEELVFRFTAGKVSFESEEKIQWVIDGEDAGRHEKMEVINHRQAVKIISGAQLTDKKKEEKK